MQNILNDIRDIIAQARARVARSINHELTLAYVTNLDYYQFEVAYIDSNKVVAITCLIFFFVTISYIIMLLSRFLLYKIANNLVKPVLHLNHILTNKVRLDSGEENFLQKSREIDELYSQIVDLHEVFYKMGKTKGTDLIDFINAKRVLKNGSDYVLAVSTCDSNVGNLSIFERKFDKAIMHLFDSCYHGLEQRVRNEIDSVHEEFLDKVERREENAVSAYELNRDIVGKDRNFTIKLESRFPKLIISYFFFFKQIEKNDKNSDIFVTRVHEVNIFESVLFDVLS